MTGDNRPEIEKEIFAALAKTETLSGKSSAMPKSVPGFGSFRVARIHAGYDGYHS